jgi:hypothetical protein
VYTGKFNHCWDGGQRRTTGEIDSITAVAYDGKYYLSFSGLQCWAPVFSPDVPWVYIKSGDIGSPSPVLVRQDGVDKPSVAELDSNRRVVFKALSFTPGGGTLGVGTSDTSRETISSSAPVPSAGFPSGATFSVSTLDDGRNVIVIANVESDSNVQIAEIDCL